MDRPGRRECNTIEDLLIPLLTLNQDVPELLKAASNFFVAAEQALDNPEGLMGNTSP